MITEQQILDQLTMLRRLARRLSGNRLDAEDLLQDTLVKCLEHRDSCNGEHVGAWAAAIMRNLFFGRYQQHKSRLRKFHLVIADMEQDPLTHEVIANASSAVDHIYAEQVLARVELMSPAKQQCLSAWIDEDGGYRHERERRVAERCGVKQGTVKSRMSRIREALAA